VARADALMREDGSTAIEHSARAFAGRLRDVSEERSRAGEEDKFLGMVAGVSYD
jgi:hypothetical protein